MAKSNKDKYLDAANKYLQKQQHEKAVKEFEKAFNEDSKNASLALKIGQLYEKIKKPPEAIKYLKIAASLYSKSGFYNRAIPVYTQILNIDPSQTDVYLEIADQSAKLGVMVRAIENYRLALKAYEEKGDTDKVLDIIRKLVEIEPQNSENRIKLAEYYFKTGHRDKGYVEFRRAAEDLKAEQRWDELVKLYDKLIKADPTNPENYHGLGEALMERGEVERAFQAYHQILRYKPDDVDAMEKIVALSIRLKDIQNAVNYLKTLASKAESKGDKESALTYLQRAYKLQPDPELKAKLGPVAEKVAPAPTRTPTPSKKPLEEHLPQEADTIEEDEITALEPASTVDTPEEVAGEEPAYAASIDDLPLSEKVGQTVEEEDQPPPTQDQLPHIFGEIDVYLQYDLVSKAEQLLARVLKAFPDNYDALRMAGRVYHRKGEHAKAVNALLSAVKSAKKAEAYDDARRFAEEILEIDPSNSQAQSIIAELDAGEEISIGIDEEEPTTSVPSLEVEESEVLTLEGDGNIPALEEASVEEAELDMAPQEELEPFSFVEEAGASELELEEAKPAGGEEPILEIEGESLEFADSSVSQEEEEEELTLGGEAEEAEAPAFELEGEEAPSVEEELIEETVLEPAKEELPPAKPKPKKAPLSKEEQIKALMEEADVYHQQGFVKEALATLGKIIAMAPDYLPALERLQQIKLDQTVLKPTTPVLEEIEELEVEEPEPEPLSAVAEGAEEALELLREEESELEIPADALEEIELESAEEELAEEEPQPAEAEVSLELHREETISPFGEEEEKESAVQMDALEEVALETQPPLTEGEIEALEPVEQELEMEAETMSVEEEPSPSPKEESVQAKPVSSLNLDEEWEEEEEEVVEKAPPVSHIEEIAEASEEAWSSALEPEQEEIPPPPSPEIQAQLEGMEEAAEEAFGSAFAEETGGASEEELETFKDLDLSSVLEEKVEPAPSSAGGAVDIDDIPSILASFRDKVHEQIGEDAGAYFDLGIAYKEMGLLDDAISSFRSALKAGANPTECLHMIALCFVDKRELNKAEAVLREGLKEENLRDEEKMILEYELGVVLEEEGRLNEALELLKDVQRMKKDFREVDSIIIRLEERIGVAESKPAPPIGRDKISYI